MSKWIRMINLPARQICKKIAALLIGLSLCGQLWAATSTSEELYLDALRAISERRMQDAKTILSHLIEIEPQHAGALLDLAIIQCELGNAKEAENLFNNIIEKFDPAPAILEVIIKHREQGCHNNRNKQINSRFSLLLEHGNDSNVNQGASNPNFSLGSGASQIDLPLLPEYLPKKDKFNALSIDYMRELAPGSTVGFVQLRAREFMDLTQFNTIALGLGAEHPWRAGNWNTSSMFMLGGLALNGHLYQKQQILQTRITPPIILPEPLQLSLIGGVTRTQYPTLLGFDANTWELRSLLIYQKNGYRIQTSLAYLADLASGARLGGDRLGVLGNIQGRKKLNDHVFMELGFTYQRWQSELPYSPGLIDQARNQRTQTLRAALSFPIKGNNSLQLEIRQVKNRENISLFEFNSKVVQASWLWLGF